MLTILAVLVLLSHAPNLMLEGVSVKVVDPQSRECCLKGYTFLLEPEAKVIVSFILPVFQFLSCGFSSESSIVFVDICCAIVMHHKKFSWRSEVMLQVLIFFVI